MTDFTMTGKTVYIVFEGYEDVAGVFSTKDEAEQFIQKRLDAHPAIYNRRDRYSIIEKIVDAPAKT